jgi:predicted nuclease of restriction endonuclease-like (RecB) superfamily
MTDVNLEQPSPDYAAFLTDLKTRIQAARTKAALAVNQALIVLYHGIGRQILKQQRQQGWGAKIVQQLAGDLRREFPDMKGLSRRNLMYMRAFAEAYPDEPFVQQVAAQLPWFHNCIVLDKIKAHSEREWYLRACIRNGWSRAVLEAQIATRLHERQGKAAHNFDRALPAPQSELAAQILKDPYNFDFLSLGDEAVERDLERGLITHLKNFLLELGAGFAFVGSQHHLEVNGKDYFLDLLFYHYRLHCFVVIDLKMTAFKPEYAGKMNFYLSAVDDLVKSPSDAPTIGMVLCKDRDSTDVEYALRGVTQPMGISSFELSQVLPSELEGVLPTVAQLEQLLEDHEVTDEP